MARSAVSSSPLVVTTTTVPDTLAVVAPAGALQAPHHLLPAATTVSTLAVSVNPPLRCTKLTQTVLGKCRTESVCNNDDPTEDQGAFEALLSYGIR